MGSGALLVGVTVLIGAGSASPVLAEDVSTNITQVGAAADDVSLSAYVAAGVAVLVAVVLVMLIARVQGRSRG